MSDGFTPHPQPLSRKGSGEKKRIVSRLAPSPTGAQHLGNARTYLIAWLSARSLGGEVILRIEDIDSPRVKAGATELIYEDLRWLGLDWDSGPFIQTERIRFYEQTLEILKAREKVYPCTCTRKDVETAASAPHLEHQPPMYPGTCSHRRVADGEAMISQRDDRRNNPFGTLKSFAWRYRGDPHFPGYEDGLFGTQRPHTSELGDFVLWKSNATPAYQLSVVVDDALMGVTEVVRGDDLIPSTYQQIQLYKEMGWKVPEFFHLPLVKGPDGKRLAKRHGDARIQTFRDAGVTAEKLIGFLAWSSGLVERPEPVEARELITHFDWGKIDKQHFTLTPEMLKGMSK